MTIDDILFPEVSGLLNDQATLSARIRHLNNALTILDDQISRLGKTPDALGREGATMPSAVERCPDCDGAGVTGNSPDSPPCGTCEPELRKDWETAQDSEGPRRESCGAMTSGRVCRNCAGRYDADMEAHITREKALASGEVEHLPEGPFQEWTPGWDTRRGLLSPPSRKPNDGVREDDRDEPTGHGVEDLAANRCDGEHLAKAARVDEAVEAATRAVRQAVKDRESYGACAGGLSLESLDTLQVYLTDHARRKVEDFDSEDAVDKRRAVHELKGEARGKESAEHLFGDIDEPRGRMVERAKTKSDLRVEANVRRLGLVS